jgi:hypothetical protein
VAGVKEEEIDGHTARMVKVISVYKILVGKPKGKRTICRYENNIKRNMKEMRNT